MKKKKNIYKILFIITIIIICIVLLLNFIFKNNKLECDSPLEYYKIIYKIDNNRYLYSKFENNYYTKFVKNDLKKVLENNKVTIDDLINSMEMIDAFNDGGSAIYKTKDNKIALYVCKNFQGNYNLYIRSGIDDYTDNPCSYNNEKKLNQTCLSTKLGGMIADLENNTYNIDAREITNGNISSWEIVKNDKVGAYAIIKTDDDLVINDFKNYFNKLNKNYKYTNIFENWYIFINNGEDINLEEFNECIK